MAAKENKSRIGNIRNVLQGNEIKAETTRSEPDQVRLAVF